MEDKNKSLVFMRFSSFFLSFFLFPFWYEEASKKGAQCGVPSTNFNVCVRVSQAFGPTKASTGRPHHRHRLEGRAD